MATYARFEKNGQNYYGQVDGDSLNILSDSPLGSFQETGESVNISDVRLLSPVSPNKVVAIGLNYKSHLGGRTGPKAPEPF